MTGSRCSGRTSGKAWAIEGKWTVGDDFRELLELELDKSKLGGRDLGDLGASRGVWSAGFDKVAVNARTVGGSVGVDGWVLGVSGDLAIRLVRKASGVTGVIDVGRTLVGVDGGGFGSFSFEKFFF